MNKLSFLSEFLLTTILFQGYHGCRELFFLPCETEKALAGHTIATINVTSPWKQYCQHQCYINESCVSYNLGPPRGAERTCELSDSDHVEYPSHVVNKIGYEYCFIKNPCSSNPCPQGIPCKPDFSSNSFRCLASCKSCPFYRNCTIDPSYQVKCTGYTPNCSMPLGMQDKTIPDSAITASAFLHYLYKSNKWESHARLSHTIGWTTGRTSYRQFLTINLNKPMNVTKVATQGGNGKLSSYQFGSFYNGWVTKYYLSYGIKLPLQYYKHNGLIKIFTGNFDQDTIVTNELPNPIYAKIIRFRPWHFFRYIFMRVELYGCL